MAGIGLKKIGDNVPRDHLQFMFVIFAVVFIYNTFQYHDFKKPRHWLINRHWVLHGRDDRIYWKRIDEIRLFNALSPMAFREKFNN